MLKIADYFHETLPMPPCFLGENLMDGSRSVESSKTILPMAFLEQFFK